MSGAVDETCDPGLRSWVETANREGTDFPVQNLPLGIFRPRDGHEAPRMGAAIGGSILDVRRAGSAGLLRGLPDALREACGAATLNPLMAEGREAARTLRRRLSEVLRSDAPAAARDASLLVPMADAELLLPAAIGDYTDFYASIHHAERVGRMLRPESPLLPNWKHVPIGYHGRSSSIVPGGTPVRRPRGQRREPGLEGPVFGPSRSLDFELEVGLYVGRGNGLGEPIPIEDAGEHIFGFSLVNDWSARDIQAWEYQPLGPFLSKSFATSVSPWVVTMDALSPFRSPAFPRPAGDPRPLPYLSSARDAAEGGIDIVFEVLLLTAEMRRRRLEPALCGRSRFRDMYWTPAQMIAHHASGGCNLRPGDLLASGTVSGPDEGTMGCLLEITMRGARPVKLPSGEERGFLEDGDEVILRASCKRDGFVRIGFGECRGTILPALPNGPPGSAT